MNGKVKVTSFGKAWEVGSGGEKDEEGKKIRIEMKTREGSARKS